MTEAKSQHFAIVGFGIMVHICTVKKAPEKGLRFFEKEQ